MELVKISETATTITLGWTPPANVGSYTLYANGKVVSVATTNLKDGTPRKEAKFSKTSPGPPFEVAALSRDQAGLFTLSTGVYGATLPGNVARSAHTGVIAT